MTTGSLMTIEFGLAILGAYLLGSVPAAYLAARWSRGIDLRKYGTGNVGASNLFRVAPKWAAIPAAIFDAAKGALSVWVAQLLGLGPALQITAGIFAIVGHNWPVFLGFRGGRGILTSLGVIAMMSPKLGLIALLLPYTLFPWRQVPLGVFILLVALPLLGWFLSQPLDIEAKLPVTSGLAVLTLVALARRLAVRRAEISKSLPLGQVLMYRLFFDRDIRNRKAWINRMPLAQEKDSDISI
ncbi:MAG: glycerol-3-phosphate acyltransferase [Chloroflexi bacterium]|nr:glycerol-3-phosphate acyltransferase [Chloroflexota bacterium]